MTAPFRIWATVACTVAIVACWRRGPIRFVPGPAASAPTPRSVAVVAFSSSSSKGWRAPDGCAEGLRELGVRVVVLRDERVGLGRDESVNAYQIQRLCERFGVDALIDGNAEEVTASGGQGTSMQLATALQIQARLVAGKDGQIVRTAWFFGGANDGFVNARILCPGLVTGKD